MRWNLWQSRPKRQRVWIVPGRDERLGIVDLGSTASRDVRSLIDSNVRNRDKPFDSGRALSASCLPLLGAGSMVASSLAAGNVFIATANPATLMAIGNGVGSAVMGTGGIVAQAPFVAASTAILPVVAPMALFMTVSSTMMAARFDRLQKSLDELSGAIHYLLKQNVTEDYARVLSAVTRLQDVSREFDESQRYTDEMKIRLALVEKDLSVARCRHSLEVDLPVSRTDTGASLASGELGVRMLPVHLHLYALSSVAGIQCDGLRLRMAVRENSADLARRVSALDESISAFRKGGAELRKENSLEYYLRTLQESLDQLGWLERNVSKKAHFVAMRDAIVQAKSIRDNELKQVLDAIGDWSEAMAERDKTARRQSIVIYRDRNGEGDPQAYYTDDIWLKAGPEVPRWRRWLSCCGIGRPV